MKLTSFLLRSSLALVAAAALLPSAAQAASIDYGSVGNVILNPDGVSPSLTGNAVRVGTFAPGFDFSLNSTNFAATNSAFTEYDNTVIGSGGAPVGQFFDTTPFLSGITGVRIFVWVFDSPNPAAATAWAIVTSNDGNWVGPADGPNSTSVDTSDAGVFIPMGALGQRVPAPPLTTANGFNIQMIAVPEPSTYAMLAVGALGLAWGVFRRRRAAA